MKTKTIKTSELEGAALDWAVAMAIGESPHAVSRNAPDGTLLACDVMLSKELFTPSTDWIQGGPLIAECGVSVVSAEKCGDFVDFTGWGATTDAVVLLVEAWGHPRVIQEQGATPLIAACRAIVASKLGETVDVPEELV